MIRSLRTAVLASSVMCASLACASTALANTYTVTSQADSGAGSLRQAITDANGHAGADTITFNMPGTGLLAIYPYSPLPAITDAVTINGTTQPSYPLVKVGGSVMNSGIYPNVDAFDITVPDVTIEGLKLEGWTRDGIQLSSSNDTITHNVIVGNARDGIYVGPNAASDSITYNNIGRAEPASGGPGVTGGGASGAAYANGADGVAFDSAGSINAPLLIDLSWNVIADNTGNGVGLFDSGGGSHPPSGIPLWNNLYAGNGGLGIDLGQDGVTPNDNLDSDSGPNALLNYPVLTAATPGAGTSTVSGTLDTSANSDLTIYFYSSPSCNPSGYGEGETRIGSTGVHTDGSGHASFTGSGVSDLTTGSFVTALTVDNAADTSEFSHCLRVPGPPSATTDQASSVGTSGATLHGTVNPDGLSTSVHFEYGPTSSYGSSTASLDAGSDTTEHALSQAVGGVAPGQTIHYRVVATNAQGTIYGADQQFTTAQPALQPQTNTNANTNANTNTNTNTNAAGGGTPPQNSATQVCIVPKLTGKKVAAAKRLLTAAHCKLGKVKTKKAAKHGKAAGKKKGTVVAQSPAAGAHEPAGTKVNLTVAR